MQQRSFAEQKDLPRLQAFLASLRRQGAFSGTFLYGDLLYETHHPLTGFEPHADIRIWEDNKGSLCGFAFLRPPNNPEFLIWPSFFGSHLEEEMIQWALARAAEKNVTTIETSCLAQDASRAEFLRRYEFEQCEGACVLMERSLHQPLPTAHLPDSYAITTLAESPEHACGIPGSGMSGEMYRQVQRAPGYRADLDVRAFYLGSILASGCTCWYDDVSRHGQFQPVGTDDEHRRRGLASAVMVQAMENLIRHGADRAVVWTDRSLSPALGLYERLGFRITHEDRGWKRRV